MMTRLENLATDIEIIEDQAQEILDQLALARETIAEALAEIRS